MPKNTPVHKLYEELRRKGATKEQAARIAQARTGLALKTGKPPKRRG